MKRIKVMAVIVLAHSFMNGFLCAMEGESLASLFRQDSGYETTVEYVSGRDSSGPLDACSSKSTPSLPIESLPRLPSKSIVISPRGLSKTEPSSAQGSPRRASLMRQVSFRDDTPLTLAKYNDGQRELKEMHEKTAEVLHEALDTCQLGTNLACLIELLTRTNNHLVEEARIRNRIEILRSLATLHNRNSSERKLYVDELKRLLQRCIDNEDSGSDDGSDTELDSDI